MNASFQLSSRSLRPGESVPHSFLYNGMGCNGKNISPHLEWTGAPPETASFALTVYDPDAPTDHGWWHWAVVNIPKDVHSLDEGASNMGKLPEKAIELMTDFNQTSYGGPCPPSKDSPHRYVFTVYALKTEQLRVDDETPAQEIKDRLEKESLDSASFTVKYGRGTQ